MKKPFTKGARVAPIEGHGPGRAEASLADAVSATPPDAVPEPPSIAPLAFEDGFPRVMLMVIPDGASGVRIGYKLWNTHEYEALNILVDALPLMRGAEQALLARLAAERAAAPPTEGDLDAVHDDSDGPGDD